jgi:catechol 2,3-dioxygenase-like lactoylglutathione lyase family enzyme
MRLQRPLLLTAAACALLLGHAGAQNAALVVGAGNFFSPIVGNLEKAVAFYRDGLGLDVMGEPANANENPPLRNMFGLPDARMRWTVARLAGVRQGVEIVEIAGAGGTALNRRITDAGAMTLVMSTSGPLADVVRRVVSHGGTPVSARGRENAAGASLAVVRDPDDHFVQLIAAATDATPLAPRIRLTVRNLNRALALYRDGLGLRAAARPSGSDDWLAVALGPTRRTNVQAGSLEVPGSTLTIEFIQFNDATGANARIQDPGSTRLQLQVRDLDAAVEAVVRAGGHVVSSGGKPVELPAGRGAPIRAAIVQDPDNLFLVLIQAAVPRA